MAGAISGTFGRRLKQARKMRGWSLAELRSRIDEMVSVAALSKYEKSQSMASSGVLVALSEALEVSLDYLFRDFSVSLERLRFRKLSTLSKKELERVIEQARDFFERYFEIEEIVGEFHRFDPVFNSGQNLDVEEMASLVRKKWKIGQDPIPNVHALLEDVGIKVWYAEDCHEKFDGFSAETERGPVAVVSRKMSAARQRMTALHEIAHILLKPLGMKHDEEEKFVVKLTGALLLPRDPLKALLGNSRKNITFGELLEIKKRFGISMSAVMVRARDLEIIPEQACTNFFRFGPGGKWRSAKEEPWDKELSDLFSEQNSRFQQLVYRAFSEELISLSQTASYLGESVEETNRLVHHPF